MHLFEITHEYRKLLARADDADGVLDESLEADLDAMSDMLTTKVEACVVVAAEMEAEEAAIKVHIDRLTARRKALGAGRERLDTYVVHNLAAAGIRQLKTDRFVVSLRASESVVVDDATALPAEFLRTKTTTEPDKTKIKAALQLGEKLSGASLVTRDSLQVR